MPHHKDKTAKVAIIQRFTVNSIGMYRRFAVLDQGIALLSEGVVTDEVAAGGLRRILPDLTGMAVR